MKNYLQQLIVLIILFFNSTAFAKINYKLHNFNIKNIYKTITCQDCCFPVDHKSCLLFYYLCKTKTYHDGMFMFSNSPIKHLAFIGDIKELYRIVFIVLGRLISFKSIIHHQFLVEVLGNIEKMRALDKTVNRQIYDENYEIVELNLERGVKQRKLVANFFLNDIKFEKAYRALKSYDNLLSSKLNNNSVKVFNSDKIASCNASESISYYNLQTTITPTNFSIINNIRLTAISENQGANIPLIIGIILGSIIVISIPIIIYNIYQHKYGNVNIQDNNSVNKENTNLPDATKETIYEEIDAFRLENNNKRIYEEVSEFTPNKYAGDITTIHHPKFKLHNLKHDNSNSPAVNAKEDEQIPDDLPYYAVENNDKILILKKSAHDILTSSESKDDPKKQDATNSTYNHTPKEVDNATDDNDNNRYQPLINRDNKSKQADSTDDADNADDNDDQHNYQHLIKLNDSMNYLDIIA